MITRTPRPVASKHQFGASFSVQYANDLAVPWRDVLLAGLDDLQIRRFRLMSHWPLIQPRPNTYQFKDLDWQMDQVAKRSGEASLTIGLRQPHYPECHWAPWARDLPRAEWEAASQDFIKEVVKRYKHHPALVSWQLENEALNQDFGQCVDYDPIRLAKELALVKEIDPVHPVIMSLKNHHSFSLKGPRPDIYATSLYLRIHAGGTYVDERMPPIYQRIRQTYIRLRTGRPFFVHELQTEPWGPRGTQDLTQQEQDVSMNPERFWYAVDYARRTGLSPVDLWGLEWWYYRQQKFGDASMWRAAEQLFHNKE